jgi:fucose 4-O-acetylase-like acetyltransferase
VQPEFFLERLAWVLMLGAGFAICRPVSGLGLLLFAGKNALVLYVIHLQVIYTLLRNVGWFREMPAAGAVWISLPVTFAGSLGVAWLLSRYLSKRNPA